MAITGNKTMPETVNTFTDVTGIALSRTGDIHVYFDNGDSINANFLDVFLSLSEVDRTEVRSALMKLIVATGSESTETVTLDGEF